MTHIENYKKETLRLKHGEHYVVPESDYGKAEIWLINETYLLFRIPMFGGVPAFWSAYPIHRIDDMINEILSWT